MFVSRLALCCAIVVSPVIASAQDATSDTVPFRAHQWAGQFGGGANYTGGYTPSQNVCTIHGAKPRLAA